MRINIKGNDITPEKIASALDSCERKYGLKIKGATIYVRFENANGQTVEPLKDGEEFSRTFMFWRSKEENDLLQQYKQPPKQGELETIDPISPKEMIEITLRINLCLLSCLKIGSMQRRDFLVRLAYLRTEKD